METNDTNLINFKTYLISNGHSSLVYWGLMKEVMPKIQDFSKEGIFNFILAKKETGVSNATVNMYIKAIRVYLKSIGRRKIYEVTPKYFKVTKKISSFITLDFLEKEIIPNLKYIFSAKKVLQIKALLYFMFYSGLRKVEIEKLKRVNFNFKENELLVYIPKTKEERLIPLNINEKMNKVIRRYFNSEPEKYNAFNLKPDSMKYIFQLLKSNFPKAKLHSHCFRHSFNFHLKTMGIDVFDRMKLLGHKNIATTALYDHFDITTLKKKFDLINQLNQKESGN